MFFLLAVVFQCDYSIIVLYDMFFWLQLPLAFVKCVWSLIFFLGFLGFLGHPSFTHWSSLQRSITFVERFLFHLEILFKSLLLLWRNVIFISFESSRCFESHFRSVSKQYITKLFVFGSIENKCLLIFLCFRKWKCISLKYFRNVSCILIRK